ncbi:hypothetical protein [Thalassobacillus pellis]|uniref:hypothetical protein n=1 Tax=Thalassobacillus pellis TaxID=748008 RepID=UPI001960BB79|nr:hypothetical protein [Thalassobacillus pellis]MBM7553430.1 DNA-binding transcriptional regulator YhcF (GntR family) [Thalassobacillus pellis]
MRHDIQPNERAFTTKEVAEEVGIATPTVRKYGQILERNGYEFFKDGDRRIFVKSDVEALIAIRDTDLPLDETAKGLVKRQKERLESEETSVAVSDTYDNSLQDPNQLKEYLKLLTQELAATREMNVQLSNDMSQLKTTVSRLQQDHHVISAGIGNSAQKTQMKIEKLTEQQRTQYESLLEQEREKSEYLERELQSMREEQQREWRSQNDFNKKLEESVNRPKGTWEKILDIFRS